jgi:hypothetical protein
MKHALVRTLFCSTIVIASASLLACAAQTPLTPASLEVISLKVSPSEVLEGQEVTITASVINHGGMPGNFDEPLMVNEAATPTKAVTVQPGATRTLTYTISRSKSGTYSVSLYNANVKFNVNAMTQQETELKYDNDRPKTVLWANYNGGFLTDFTPPNPPFRIDKVRICGGIYGVGWEGRTFDLDILDSDMKSVMYNQTYAIAKFPVRGTFPYQPPQWVEFTIPPMTLDGKFYVYLYTSTGEHKGVHVGVDDSVLNDHSQLAQGKPPYITAIAPGNIYPPNIWYSDITKDNWMIRAVGTSLVPSQHP